MAAPARTQSAKGPTKVNLEQMLIEAGEYTPNISPASLSLLAILRFTQMRKTFDGIEDLANSIARTGLMHPIVVAAYDDVAAVHRYGQVLSELWGRPVEVPTAMTVDGEFHILVAGERRYRAHLHLWEHGCTVCREKHGAEPSGKCYRRHQHLQYGQIEVRRYRHLPVLAAVFMQFSENIHRPVPVHEEADAYQALLETVRKADSRFSLAAFARSVGRSEDYIRNALKFCDLPQEVQDLVREGRIAFGHAIALARYAQQVPNVTIIDILTLANRVIVEQMRVKEFDEYVAKIIADRTSGTVDLFVPQPLTDLVRSHIRRTFQIRLVPTMHQLTAWLGLLQRACESGEVGPTYAEGSPTRLYITIVERLYALLPYMLPMVPANQRSEVQLKVVQMHDMARRAKRAAGDDTV